jgi:hypothetical protein
MTVVVEGAVEGAVEGTFSATMDGNKVGSLLGPNLVGTPGGMMELVWGAAEGTSDVAIEGDHDWSEGFRNTAWSESSRNTARIVRLTHI